MTSPPSDRQYTLTPEPIAVKHTFPLGKRKYTFRKPRVLEETAVLQNVLRQLPPPQLSSGVPK